MISFPGKTNNPESAHRQTELPLTADFLVDTKKKPLLCFLQAGSLVKDPPLGM